MSEVKYHIEEGVAVLTMERGRANALAPSLRADLAAALERAAGDDQVAAVVLQGAGGVFSSGVDIAEYDAPLASPWIDVLARRIETFPKPVVAALHGAALGAGLELALAAHGRVVRNSTRLAQPEVTLSLVPGGGATQRLPRLLGAQAALELMLAGRAVAPDDPRLRQIFDEVTTDEPLAPALALARRLARAGTWTRTCDIERGFSDPEGYQKAISAVGAQVRAKTSAEADVLRCVEAAQLLPFEQGLAFERTVFEERIASPAARAIRHVYTAERRAQMHPGLQDARPREIRQVALIGDDPQVAQLAIHCLDQGQHVTITGPNADALAARTAAIYEAAVSRGRLADAAREAALARLAIVPTDQAIPVADLVLEAKGSVPGSARPKPDAVWCVLDDVGQAELRAADLGTPVVTLRVYRPAHSSRLAEFAALDTTPVDVLASVVAYFGRAGRSVLRSAVRPGLLGHRAMAPGLCAALSLVRAGADPSAVDLAARDLGFADGPFRMIEIDGPAEVEARLERICGSGAQAELDLLRALRDREDGETGATEGKDSDPALAHWLQAWRSRQGDLPSLPQGVSLRDAMHAALVNGAARMIEGREVMRASDIDLCFVQGYGFARDKGGPLLQADILGLLPLVRKMKTLQEISENIWKPAPLVEEMVKYGKRFF
ncbi:enoyl-CoA hydratase/isomerase family protein [Roseovarius aestuariivivens]|uniref:enoyl-CoA hydratase/isomerase family protein n=1 Tax=Roseovarius aestuariivivens TaxID=1888910 RepID=UPI0010804FDF|nr:enoyl-CoA hydratase/isomerase family protein [Roseovarius aestuariivivens]